MQAISEEFSRNPRRVMVSILALLGILVSLFIAFVVEKGPVLGCNIEGTNFNCTQVLSSQYAYVFGIPVSILATLWFVVILALYLVDFYDDFLIAGLSLLGLASVFYFVYLELFVILNICLYCTLGHIIGVIIFLLVGPHAIKNSYYLFKEKLNKAS